MPRRRATVAATGHGLTINTILTIVGFALTVATLIWHGGKMEERLKNIGDTQTTQTSQIEAIRKDITEFQMINATSRADIEARVKAMERRR